MSQFLCDEEEGGVAPFLQNVRLEISLWPGHLGSNSNLFTIILLTLKSRKSLRMVSLWIHSLVLCHRHSSLDLDSRGQETILVFEIRNESGSRYRRMFFAHLLWTSNLQWRIILTLQRLKANTSSSLYSHRSTGTSKVFVKTRISVLIRLLIPINCNLQSIWHRICELWDLLSR
jgi:hypothetical protein